MRAGEYSEPEKAGLKKCYVCLLWRRSENAEIVKIKEYDLDLNPIENELYRCKWDCPGYSIVEWKLKRGELKNL